MKPANGVDTVTSENIVPVGVRLKLAPRLVRSRKTAICPRVMYSDGQYSIGSAWQPLVYPPWVMNSMYPNEGCPSGTSAKVAVMGVTVLR